MKFLLVLLAISAAQGLKCQNEGCYEAIKHFSELLEQKIVATEAVSLILSLA